MSINISGFESYLTNVDSIEDAEIVALGETHFNITDQKRNGRIIDALYRPGDVVLVESSDENLKGFSRFPLLFQTHFVTKPIAIKGWDIHTASLIRTVCQEVVPLLVGSLIVGGILNRALGLRISIGTAVTMIGGAFRMMSLSGGDALKRFRLRNQNMVKVIDEKLRNGVRRVIVIGGKLHFEESDSYLKQQGFDNTESVKEVMDYFSTKKFAILT